MKHRKLLLSFVQLKAAPLIVLASSLILGSVTAAPTLLVLGPDNANITDKQQNFYHPFSNVSVSDSSGSPVTFSILFDHPTLGSFRTPLPAGVSGSAGSYAISQATAAAVTTTLQSLIYDPAQNQIDIGSTANVTFTIWATDTNNVSSVTNSDRNVTIIPVNDAPTITGTTQTNTTDKISVKPFAQVTLGDVDNRGTQPITVTISRDDSNKGIIAAGGSGFTTNSGNYVMSGSPSAVTTAIRQLVFVPAENHQPVGTNEITTFTITYTDGLASAGVDANTTVSALSINDPPVIGDVSGTPALLQTGNSYTPFPSATINDVDFGDYTNSVGQHVSLEVTFAGASANGQWIAPSGLGQVSGSSYRLSLVTLSDATYALQHLLYQAQTFPISNTNTVTFSIVATDDHSGSTTNNLASVNVYTPFTPPGLSGTRSNQRVNDNATLALFSSVSVQSFNGGSFSVVIHLDNDAKGSLINLAGFVRSGTNYIFTGTSEAATVAIRQLLFQPTNNRISGGSSETATFFITLVDGGISSAADASTTVTVSPVNDAPTIQGIAALVTIADNSAAAPFPTLLILDSDEVGLQNQTVTVRLDDNVKGSFTTNSLAASGFVNNAGNYTRTGSPAAVTAAIHQLLFAPTPQRLPSGASENTVFIVTVDDGQGGVVVNNLTTIRVAALGGGPVISLPSPQPVSLPLAPTLSPFSSSTISDPQNVVLTVQITNSTWGLFTSNSLAAFGFTNASPGTYTVSGTASNVTAALQGLEFAPNTNIALGTVIVFGLNAANQTGNSTPAVLAITLRLNQRSLIVTKTSDYDPNDGSVTEAQKGGTLRKAIQDAGSNDHITFDIRSSSPGLPDYPATINLKTNLILNNNVIFDGPGADLLSISGDTDGNGSADQQIFEVNAQVVINRLTLTKGHHPFSGGAIEVNSGGTLKLSYCAVTDSKADVWGGGIDVNGGGLSVDHCLIKGNTTSSTFGQGGGGVSLYTDQACQFINTTFAGNQQLAPSGLGGGGLYAENLDAGTEFGVLVLSCTFHDNTDAAGSASSIRPNVFDTEIMLQNTIIADGQGKNLQLDQSGDILSLGGNLSDDSTRTIFSIGGVPYDITIFAQPPDFTNTPPNLLALGDNHGPTLTYALNFNSPAINASVSNSPDGTYYSTLGTDQRSYWRTDGSADIGAFERGASQHVIMEEILFADTNNQFIEFYVPRDSTSLNLENFKVLVHGQLLHTFTNQNLQAGQAVVLFAQNAANTVVPGGVFKQIASSSALMDPSADTITLLNPSNQVVLEVSYVGSFVSSDPLDPGFLTAPNQSIVLSPSFLGAYLPYQRVVAHETGLSNVTATSNPGYDPTGTPLAPGNAPPRAYDDFASTDAQTPLPDVSVLKNDKDPDIADALRVVGVGITNGSTPGVFSLAGTSHYGAGVLIISNGLSLSYDPTTSGFLRSLPQGSNVVDWLQYTILDSSNGVDHVRGTTTGEISNNIVKATATVSLNIVGVNLAPTPQDDGTNTDARLITSEDALLDFTTADTILANDSDPNTDDNASTLTIVSIESTNGYRNSLQAISALGAFVTLDIRFNRAETHITYDPRDSAVLNSLAVGQTAVDTFYYSVMDRHGAIGTAAVHITVLGRNDLVQATADLLATDEDTPLTIPAAKLLANDIDPDTGITNPVPPHLIISAIDAHSALGASLAIVGTNVIYDPTVSSNLNALARKEVVVDTFTYTARDDFGGTSNAVASVTITGRNDAPIPLPDFYLTGEKIPLPIVAPGLLSNDRDPDVNGVIPDDTIRVIPVVKTSLMGASVTLNADGSFVFDPRGVFDWLIQGQETNDTYTYTIMDHSFSIANDDEFSVQGNSSANVLSVLANDALLSQVGGALIITDVSAPSKAGTVAIDASANTLIYSPAANFVGSETFTYFVSDGLGGTDFANVTVTVTVDPLNGNLVANPDSFTVPKGTTVNLDVLANDNILPATGAALTILSVGSPNHGGQVSINGSGPNNSLTYTPSSANTFPLTESFTYVITGGGIAQSTGTVSIALVDLSNTLTANQDTFSVIANDANYPLDVLANDLILPGPNTNLTITSIQTNNVIGTVSINPSGTGLLYRPPPGVSDHQEPLITYTISDGAGGTSSSTVSIFVLSSSGTGFFANDDFYSVTENSQSNSLAVLLNDALLPGSGETLTITDIGLAGNAPNHGGGVTIDPTGKSLIYTPAANFVGLESFTYEISYGTVVRAQGRVYMNVIATTNLPSMSDSYDVVRNSVNNPLPVLQNDYPLPRTLLALTISRLETNGVRGTVSINGNDFDNNLLFTPAPGFIGRETFRYVTSDGRGNKGTNLVAVIVGNLNPHPDLFSVVSGSASNSLDVLANDAMLPDTTTVRPISGLGTPDHGGTVTTNGTGTRVLYTPPAGFTGIENFTYQMKDDSGGVVTGNASVSVLRVGSDRSTNTVTVTIVGTNDPPTITGTQGGWQITDKQAFQLFTNVTIADVDARGLQTLTVTVSLDNSMKGVLTNLGGFLKTGLGLYSLTGLGADITAAIRGIYFVPTQNRITVPTSEITAFTITAYDGYVSVTNTDVTVNVTAVNDPPVITGTVANQRVYAHLSILPFAGTTITEVDDLGLQPLSVTVTVAQTNQGFLTALGPFVSLGNGMVGVTNVTGAQASSALRSLLYVPTPNGRLNPGQTETNRFTIAVNDRFAPTVSDSVTTVISTDAFIKRVGTLDGNSRQTFAYSVASDRDMVVSGAPNDTNTSSIATGSASLILRTNGGPEAWAVLKRVIGSDSAAGDQFGYSVGLSGTTLVVGAPSAKQAGKSSGVAYVFTNIYVNATQAIKLIPADGVSSDLFGQAVAISGDDIAIGASANGGRGAVYVFNRNQGGPNNWGLVKKLSPADGAAFGFSVAMSGDTIAVGSPNNNNRVGAVYAFDRNNGPTNNAWGLTQKILATDGVVNDSLGYSVAISGNLIVTGSPYKNSNSATTGRLYVFDRNQGGVNNWGQANAVGPFDGIVGSNFGITVAVDGELFAAGTFIDAAQSGGVYVYARNWPGLPSWSALEKILPPSSDTYAAFGMAISLKSYTLAAGARFDTANNTRFAETYIYRLRFNNSPAVPAPIPDQIAAAGQTFAFAIPASAFGDPDVLDGLNISLVSGPSWLTLTNVTLGGLAPATPQTNVVTLRATDQEGVSITTSFNVMVRIGALVVLNTLPENPLVTWRSTYFPSEWLDSSLEDSVWGNQADPDGDGVSNLEEYLFGTDPQQADERDSSPLVIQSTRTGFITLSFKRRVDDTRLTYQVEGADNSLQWQALPNSWIRGETLTPLNNAVEQVVQRLQLSDLPPGLLFFRLQVSHPDLN